jgi:hypothetical protein
VAARPCRLPFGALSLRASTLAILALLCACSGGLGGSRGSTSIGGGSADPQTVDFPIFYVKRSVPAASDDLRMLAAITGSADLYMRASASPDAAETNITTSLPGPHDIKDVDTSPDGKKVAFAFRGPLAANPNVKKKPFWQIYEYTISTGTLALMIAFTIDQDFGVPLVNDVSPHYLPDGRLLFSSTRQRQSRGVLVDEGKAGYLALDEDQQEPAFDLHVINAERTEITQITFNQSHDLDATVLQSGRILFSRWDHALNTAHDAMSLYTANPDGTDVELYYGANSHATGTGNGNGSGAGDTIEFVRPKEMQDGRILTLIRPYTDGQANATTGIAPLIDSGGDLIFIDGQHYVENTQAADPTATASTGPAQTPATTFNVATLPGPSPGGRFSSAYPLWDGTGRLLVTYTQCRLQDTKGNLMFCTPQNLAANPPLTSGPPLYSVWIYSPSQNTFLPVMQPVEGIMVTDVAAAQPRATVPNVILPNPSMDQSLVSGEVGVLDIRSVYDFDGTDKAPNGGIAGTASGATAATQRTARFLRLVKAVSIPDTTVVNLADEAFGANGRYMREILGYIPVEPDGSVKVRVPANVAFQIQVLDANARLIFPTHGTWLQLAAGEVVQCNGCHTPAANQMPAAGTTAKSHGRTGVFASAYPAWFTAGSAYPGSVAALTSGKSVIPAAPGDTMAQTLTAATCVSGSVCSAQLSLDVQYTDLWTAGKNPAITIPYTGLLTAIPTSATCESGWSVTCRTIINYPEHIQPIWDLQRTMPNGQTTSCSASCHTGANPAGGLNLSSTASNNNPPWPISYVNLLIPTITQVVNAAGQVVSTTQIGPYFDAGNANGVNSSVSLQKLDPVTGDTIHKGALTQAELRLISEWLDIGAQYFNNPSDPQVPVN